MGEWQTEAVMSSDTARLVERLVYSDEYGTLYANPFSGVVYGVAADDDQFMTGLVTAGMIIEDASLGEFVAVL